jgi:hypothetical protein
MLYACGGSADTTLEIDTITPDFGPLGGGTRIVISGQGFLANAAPPNRVVIGDTEAPLAGASDDGSLEVTVPPGKTAGPVSVTVFNRNGRVTAMGKFHYSTAPTITSVSPANVLFDSISTTVTVTGTGFMDEGAGPPTVTVAGTPAVDVQVVSDTQLTFTARPGAALSKPTIEIENVRGVAEKTRAYRYIPFMNAGLVMFAKSQTIFAIVFDPATQATFTIPTVTPNATGVHMRGSFIENGDIFMITSRPGRSDMKFGRLDFETQTLADTVPAIGAPTTLLKSGTNIFTVNRVNGQFMKFDRITGDLTTVSALPNAQGHALATDGTMNFLGNGAGISTIDVATGTRGAVVAFNPSIVPTEMRFLAGQLFVADRNGSLFTVNPTTGVTTLVKTFATQLSGMEIFQP